MVVSVVVVANVADDRFQLARVGTVPGSIGSLFEVSSSRDVARLTVEFAALARVADRNVRFEDLLFGDFSVIVSVVFGDNAGRFQRARVGTVVGRSGALIAAAQVKPRLS